jgi:hypothetical protein
MPSLVQLRQTAVAGAYERLVDPVLVFENRDLAAALAGLKSAAQSVETFSEDHPAIVVFVAALALHLAQNRRRIDLLAPNVQRLGVAAGFALPPLLAFPGSNRAQIDAAGVWASPGLERTEELVDFLDRPAWRDKLDNYEAGVAAIVLNTIRDGGRPEAVVAEVERQALALPAFYAGSVLRTLQFAAYRDAATIQFIANSDIIEYILRVAVLDNRTCAACVALHGTKWPADHIVDDHHRGRCIGVPSVLGNRREVAQTGEEWLLEQDEEVQRTILGGATWRAWTAGAIELGDVVGSYEDGVFGGMVRTRSLVGMIGAGAEQYYEVNQ